jgi:hypothetical protein
MSVEQASHTPPSTNRTQKVSRSSTKSNTPPFTYHDHHTQVVSPYHAQTAPDHIITASGNCCNLPPLHATRATSIR